MPDTKSAQMAGEPGMLSLPKRLVPSGAVLHEGEIWGAEKDMIVATRRRRVFDHRICSAEVLELIKQRGQRRGVA
ncbi:MAG TPA: hypothetical protein VEB21_16350, partial [Terriglobales bacterium]|nr:hypothetical protein [Terriglobales bacterium]